MSAELPRLSLTIPNGAQVPWSPLTQKTPRTHTHRTHGTHEIDTGAGHRLSNTDRARDLTRALPDSAQLGPWAQVKSHTQDRAVRSGHLGVAGARPQLGGLQLF